MKRKNGFTLIELVVVIALIAILAVTLAPRLRDQIAKGRDAKAIGALGALRTSAEVFFADYGVSLLTAGTNNAGALTLAMDGLNDASKKMFTDSSGNDFDPGTITRTGNYPTVAAAGVSTTLLVPIGGHRASAGTDSSTNPITFGGLMGFAVQTGDGVDVEFVVQGTNGDFDTKGLGWTSY